MGLAAVEVREKSLPTLKFAADRWAGITGAKVSAIIDASANLLLTELAISADQLSITSFKNNHTVVALPRFIVQNGPGLRGGGQRKGVPTTQDAADLIDEIELALVGYKETAIGMTIRDAYKKLSGEGVTVRDLTAAMLPLETDIGMDAAGLREDLNDCTRRIRSSKEYTNVLDLAADLRDSVNNRSKTLDDKFAQERAVEAEVHRQYLILLHVTPPGK